MEAVQLTAVALVVLTRNEPLELPGAPPCCMMNWPPEGPSVRLSLEATNSVTGTEPLPPDVEISTWVRKKPGPVRAGFTVMGIEALAPPASAGDTEPAEHHEASQVMEPIPSEPPPAF